MGKESAYTSLRQIPAGFKKFEFGKINLDWGGGKYDLAKDYLCTRGTYNFVYDKYNRTPTHNMETTITVRSHKTETVTVFNVLNVIQTKKERTELLRAIKRFCKEQKKFHQNDPVVIFQVYEGNRSGVPSKNTVQTNMKTAAYIPEIQSVFPEWEVQRQGNFIIV